MKSKLELQVEEKVAEKFAEQTGILFDELRIDLVSVIREELRKAVKEILATLIKDEFKATLNIINKDIISLQNTVESLQKQMIELKESNEKRLPTDKLFERIDDNEQYSRRLCLRVRNVPLEEGESADQILKKVKSLIRECKVTVPDNILNRAH